MALAWRILKTKNIKINWKKIKFETTSTGSVLDYVSMYYGSGEPELIGSASAEFKTVDYAP